MKRLLVPLLALVVALSACDVVGSNVAATVEGKDITVDQVRQLVAAQAKQAGKKAPSSMLDGSAARAALADWIQVIAAEHELAKRKGSVQSADTQSATQQMASYPGLPAATRKQLETGIASAIALVRVLSADDSDVIAKLARQVYARVPAAQRVLICSQAIAGPADAESQVQQLLDSGATLDDPSAFSAAGYQSVGTNGKLCINPTQLPSEIQSLYANAPKGVLEHGAFTSQASDGSSQSGVIFFKVIGPGTLTPTDPAIIQSVQQEVQQQPSLVLSAVFAKATIHVDPRFGTGFNLLAGVLPPVTPRAPATRGSTSRTVTTVPSDSSTTTPSG